MYRREHGGAYAVCNVCNERIGGSMGAHRPCARGSGDETRRQGVKYVTYVTYVTYAMHVRYLRYVRHLRHVRHVRYLRHVRHAAPSGTVRYSTPCWSASRWQLCPSSLAMYFLCSE